MMLWSWLKILINNSNFWDSYCNQNSGSISNLKNSGWNFSMFHFREVIKLEFQWNLVTILCRNSMLYRNLETQS